METPQEDQMEFELWESARMIEIHKELEKQKQLEAEKDGLSKEIGKTIADTYLECIIAIRDPNIHDVTCVIQEQIRPLIERYVRTLQWS